MIAMSSEMEHDHQVTLNVTAAFCVSELILSLHGAGGVALGGKGSNYLIIVWNNYLVQEVGAKLYKFGRNICHRMCFWPLHQ